MEPPKAFALNVTHDKVAALLAQLLPTGRVLDCGAGCGALSWRLTQQYSQFDALACDIHEGEFDVDGVRFSPADLNQCLPYPDSYFDAVCAVEVVEHLENRFAFFREINRVLRPGGVFIMTTPNIANLSSRMKFLFSGFYMLFSPLNDGEANPICDHVNPLPLHYYRYALSKTGFENGCVITDRIKTGSAALMWLYPLVYVYSAASLLRRRDPGSREVCRKTFSEYVRPDILCGRTIILSALKKTPEQV